MDTSRRGLLAGGETTDAKGLMSSVLRPTIAAALTSPNVALVEAVVDANEKPSKPDEPKV
jgi:hypothetical protein